LTVHGAIGPREGLAAMTLVLWPMRVIMTRPIISAMNPNRSSPRIMLVAARRQKAVLAPHPQRYRLARMTSGQRDVQPSQILRAKRA
jgi:hypothetical protein